MCKEQWFLIPRGEISLLEIRSKTEHQGVLREVRKSFSFFCLYIFPFQLVMIEKYYRTFQYLQNWKEL